MKKQMTHHEKLEYWKKYDPIHYSEMTSDPTGVNSEPLPILPIIIFIIGLIGFGYFIYKAFVI